MAVRADRVPLTRSFVGNGNAEPRGARGEQTRVRILEAAKIVFADPGYELVSIDDIARAAGVSRPTFYVYFPNKFAAAEALADCFAVFVLKDIEKLAALGADPSAEDISAWVERRFAVTARNGDYVKIFRHVAAVEAAFGARTRARYLAAFEQLAVQFPAFARAAEAPLAAPALRAQLLFAQLDQICGDLVMGWKADRARLAALFATQFHAFLNDTNMETI